MEVVIKKAALSIYENYGATQVTKTKDGMILGPCSVGYVEQLDIQTHIIRGADGLYYRAKLVSDEAEEVHHFEFYTGDTYNP